MHDLKSIVGAFNQYVDDNRFTEALILFYWDDIISIDNDSSFIRGRQRMLELTDTFLKKSRNLSTRALNSLVSEHTSIEERKYTFDMPEGGHYNFKQISIQQWADAKIWYERHYFRL